jgi:hypothetical protein
MYSVQCTVCCLLGSMAERWQDEHQGLLSIDFRDIGIEESRPWYLQGLRVRCC